MSARGFDEVMIVNPQEGAGPALGVKLMPYYDANYPEMGGYADPVGDDPYAGYGQEYVGPETYGSCDGGEPNDWGDPAYGYAQADPGPMEYPSVGYVAQEPYASPYGYAGTSYGCAGAPMVGGYAAAPAGFGCAGDAPCPRCSGLSDDQVYGYAADEGYARDDGYAEEDAQYSEVPGVDGYAPDLPSRFNARFGIPGSLAGSDQQPPLDGFVKPRPVGPVVRQFTPPPEQPPSVPDAFKPLW